MPDCSYAQPFFLSCTWFNPPTYPPAAVADFLERAGIEPVDYPAHGIFVLRATVMNPYIVLAEEYAPGGQSKSYLAEFMQQLGQEIEQALVILQQS